MFFVSVVICFACFRRYRSTSPPSGYQVTRRVVAPWSNCTSGVICSTNWTCTTRKFTTFGQDFLCRKQLKAKNCWDHSASICLNLISWKYQRWTLRNEKVIRCQATVLHDAKSRKCLMKKWTLCESPNRNICLDRPSPITLTYFSRPAGGRSLRASVLSHDS